MKFLEIVILLCIVSSTVAIIRSKTCSSKVYLVHNAVDVSNIRNNCFCPNPNYGYQIANILNKQNSDIERVVVFYYRDKTNNRVYMHTPDGEAQLAIPELLLYGDDDLKKIGNPVTIRLFDISPAIVLPQNFQYPNYDRHQNRQQLKHRLPHLSKVDNYSPQAWYYQQNMYNSLRPDKLKSNNEVDHIDILSEYDLYSSRDNKKWAESNKNFLSQNIEVYGNKADQAQTSNANSYDFDYWYSKNAIQFPELYSGDLKYITFNDLRAQILHIFNGHGYSIINEQVLDPQGEVVKSSNYKLVRVKIKQDNDEKKVSSEVEGVMVINLVPMTILGVVPLTNNIEETDVYQSAKKQTSQKQLGGQLDTRISSKVKVNARKNITKVTPTKESMTTESPEASSNPKPKRLDAFINKLYQAVNRLVPSRRESVIDPPEFRIIGGNAATGSGAPISSKGRSGTPH